MEGLEMKYTRDINILKDKDKMTKINTLKKLINELPKEEGVSELFSTKLKFPLFVCLSDPADKCKELSVTLLLKLLPLISQEDIPHILESLYSRLGSEPPLESCEEVRILEISLLKSIVSERPSVLGPSLGNIVDMLAKLGKDRCPEIKNQVSEIVVLLAHNTDLRVGFFGRKLYASLAVNLVHQQFKVRGLALKAIGELALCEGGQGIIDDSLMNDFKKIHSDRRNEVKIILSEVLHSWLLSLPYSFLVNVEGKLLYLLLGAQTEINSFLCEIGIRRKQMSVEFDENVQEIFHAEPLEFVILKNLSKLVAFCLEDIQEWTIQDYHRSRSLQTLVFVSALAKDFMTLHLEDVVKVFVRACARAEDKEYIQLFHDCMQQLGQYCDSQFLMNLCKKFGISDMCSPSEKATALSLLLDVVRSTPSLDLEQTVGFITSADVIGSDSLQVLNSAYSLIKAFIERVEGTCRSFANSLFFALLVLESSSVAVDMQILGKYCECSHPTALYELLFDETFSYIVDSYNLSSYQGRILLKNLVLSSGGACTKQFERLIQLVSSYCSVSNDSDTKIGMLEILNFLLNHPDLYQKNSENSRYILESIIIPICSHKDGIPVRIAGVNSFLSILPMIPPPVVTEIWSSLFPALKSCLNEDWEAEMRVVSLECLNCLIGYFFSHLDEIQVLDIYPEILKRLDDSQNRIRIRASETLSTYFQGLPTKVQSFGNYKYVLSSLFVQIDDSNEDIQKAMRKTLEVAMTFNKQQFLEVAREVQPRHSHPRQISELIELASRLT